MSNLLEINITHNNHYRSVGCIMAELLTGRPLFPGDDRKTIIYYYFFHSEHLFSEIDQITKVLKICGTPTNETLSKITSEEVSAIKYSISCMNNFHLTRQSCTYVHFPKWKRRTFKQYFLMQIPWVNLFFFLVNQYKIHNKIQFSAINLMEKMLEIDADKRINAAQTLSHPYLEEVKMKMFEICLIIISTFSMLILLMNPLLHFMTKHLKIMI